VHDVCYEVCSAGGPFGEAVGFLFLAVWGVWQAWKARRLRREVDTLSRRPPPLVPVNLQLHLPGGSLEPGPFGGVSRRPPPPPPPPDNNSDGD